MVVPASALGVGSITDTDALIATPFWHRNPRDARVRLVVIVAAPSRQGSVLWVMLWPGSSQPRTLGRANQARKGLDTGQLSGWLFASRIGQDMQQHSACCDAMRTGPSPI